MPSLPTVGGDGGTWGAELNEYLTVAHAANGTHNIIASVWRTVGATGEPAFSNSWVLFGSVYEAPAFYKDMNGRVHLRGMTSGGSPIPGAIFTLPVGYRPALRETFATVSNGALGRIDVYPDGQVRAELGSNAWFNLSGASFSVA